MIHIDEIVKEVSNKVSSIEQRYIQSILGKVLGCEIDCWGDIKSISQPLVEEILNRPEVKDATTELVNAVAKEASKPFSKNTILSLAKRVREQLLSDIEEQIYKELRDEISFEISKSVKESIKTHPKLAPYLVAGHINRFIK